MKTYPSDLTESPWQVIENLVNEANIHDSVGIREVMLALKFKYHSGISKIFTD